MTADELRKTGLTSMLLDWKNILKNNILIMGFTEAEYFVDILEKTEFYHVIGVLL